MFRRTCWRFSALTLHLLVDHRASSVLEPVVLTMMGATTEIEITPPDSLVKFEAPIFAGLHPSKEGSSAIKLKEGSTKVRPAPAPVACVPASRTALPVHAA